MKKSYERYSNFKIKLKDAIREVNERTDVYISFEEIKQGRSISSLKFYIENQEIESTNNNLLDPNGLDEDALLEQEYIRFEEMRLKLNEHANGYSLDGIVFAEIYGKITDMARRCGKSIHVFSRLYK
ncbi:hypothetical protein ACFVRU_56800 [Streptomyces sp. NPDC057927]